MGGKDCEDVLSDSSEDNGGYAEHEENEDDGPMMYPSHLLELYVDSIEKRTTRRRLSQLDLLKDQSALLEIGDPSDDEEDINETAHESHNPVASNEFARHGAEETETVEDTEGTEDVCGDEDDVIDVEGIVLETFHSLSQCFTAFAGAAMEPGNGEQNEDNATVAASTDEKKLAIIKELVMVLVEEMQTAYVIGDDEYTGDAMPAEVTQEDPFSDDASDSCPPPTKSSLLHQWRCGIRLVRATILSSSSGESDDDHDCLRPHDVVRLAVECHATRIATSTLPPISANGGKLTRSLVQWHKSMMTVLSLLAVHVGTLGLKRALDETRESLESPSSQVIRWRRLSSMVSQVLELCYRSVIAPLRQQWKRQELEGYDADDDDEWDEDIDVNEEYDYDDEDDDEDNQWNVQAYQVQQHQKGKACQVAVWGSWSPFTIQAVVKNVIDDGDSGDCGGGLLKVSNQLLSLVEEHHSEDSSVPSNDSSKPKFYTVHSDVLALVGFLSQLVDTVAIGENYKNVGETAGVTSNKFGTNGNSVDGSSKEVEKLQKLLCRRLLDVPIPMRNVMVHPLRCRAWKQYQQRTDVERRKNRRQKKSSQVSELGEDSDYVFVDDLYDESREDHVAMNRMERFRLNPTRRYFDGSIVPWNLRGLAIVAYWLLIEKGDNSDGSDSCAFPGWGAFSPRYIWSSFYPHSTTLMLRGDVRLAYGILSELNARLPLNSEAASEVFEPYKVSPVQVASFVNGEGVQSAEEAEKADKEFAGVAPTDKRKGEDDEYKGDTLRDPRNLLGVVGPVQLCINIMVNSRNDTTASGGKSDSTIALSQVRSLLGRVRPRIRRLGCISALISDCPYPAMTPILLDLIRPIVTPRERGDEDVDTDGDHDVAVVGKVLVITRPFIEEMRGYWGDPDSNEHEAASATDVADTSVLRTLMEQHEAYHATCALIELVLRYREDLRRKQGMKDRWTTSDASSVIVDRIISGDLHVASNFQKWLECQLKILDTSSSSSSKNVPMDFHRLYLLNDAITHALESSGGREE